MGNKAKEELIGEFRTLNDAAHEEDMEVILDVNPSVFGLLNASYENLAVFKERHADGIRLDEGFSGMRTSLMTFNPQGLKIELNARTEMGMISDVIIANVCASGEELRLCAEASPGGLHIVLKDMPNDGRKNVISHLPACEFMLLDNVGPWKVFAFQPDTK